MNYEQVVPMERILAKKMLAMHPSEAIDAAWAYFYYEPFTWHGDSRRLNIKTELEILHEDINGFVADTVVHRRHDGTIYCTSTDLDEYGIPYGEDPLFYIGDFEINNHDFELNFDALEIGEIQFIPKKEAAYNTY